MNNISTPDRRQSKTLLILDECGGSNIAINSVFNCHLSPFGQNAPREHSANQLTFINPYCANRNKSRLLFSSAEMFKKPLWQTVWIQIRLLLAVCSGSTLFASLLNFSVMIDNYLRQTTSADDIFRCIFYLAL